MAYDKHCDARGNCEFVIVCFDDNAVAIWISRHTHKKTTTRHLQSSSWSLDAELKVCLLHPCAKSSATVFFLLTYSF